MQNMKNLFKSTSVLFLLSLFLTACDSGSKDSNYQTDTKLIEQALKQEMDKLPSVNPQSEATLELHKAIDYYFGGKNAGAALPILTKLAKQNNPDAYYYLGLIYTDNKLQYYDIKIGLSHLSTAINLGHSQAMHRMGVMHDNGIGVQQDALMAKDWYRKAKRATKPNQAKTTFYKQKNNKLEEVEYDELFQDLLKQAKGGNAEVQYRVAKIFDEGYLIPRDLTKALEWYEKSAQNNYEEAQFTMGYFYCRGIGVEKNLKLANDWLLKSNRMVRCLD